MSSEDPYADDTAIENQQTDDSEEDIDMLDAISEESTNRQPRKLNSKSGKCSHETIQQFETIEDGDNRGDRDAATYHDTPTIRATYERTDYYSRSFSSRESNKRKVLVRGGAIRNPKREPDLESQKFSEDIPAHAKSADVDTKSRLRPEVEGEVIRLRNSLKLLERKQIEDSERLEKLEDDLTTCETRLAVTSKLEERWRTLAEKRESNLEDIQTQWDLWKGKWKIRRAQLIDDVQQLVTERENWVSEKEGFVSERQQWETAQKRSEADLKDIRIRWKQTAKELNSLRAQGQGFYQVDDNYLEDMIQTLRYNIRNFSIQYFSGSLPTEPKFTPNEIWKNYMEVTVDGDEVYRGYINSPEKRPSIVQAFLWRIVVSEIYDNFRWTGSAALSILELYKGFNPHPNVYTETAAEIDFLRKVYTWRATTVDLLLRSMDQSQRLQADTELQEWKYELFKHVDINLRLLQPEYQEKYRNDFLDIVDEAVKLDEELCRQVSRVIWTFDTEDETKAFNSDYMELESGETPPEHGRAVALVVAPQVLKQGKSSGAGFESTVCLLKMQVSCEIPETDAEVQD